MQIQKLTLEQFGSGTFLKEYARGSDSLANFYSFYPLHNNRIEELYKNRIRSIEGSFKKERIGIVSALQSFHATLGIDEEQREIREKLLRDDCFCVVTGQQLAWYGGPLYTFFKLISTILKAKEISKVTGKTIVPVFWLADEDHDYDEINTSTWYEWKSQINSQATNKQSICHRISSDSLACGNEHDERQLEDEKGKPVSQIMSDVDDFKEQLRNFLTREYLQDPGANVSSQEELESFFHVDTHVKEAFELISACYHSTSNHAQNFVRWLLSQFPNQGILIAGSHDPALKRYLQPVIQQALERHPQITAELKNQSSKIEKMGFRAQVAVMDSQWFMMNSEAKRVKLQLSADGGYDYREGSSIKHITEDQLLEMIQRTPERLSPNALMRPLLQEFLLPVCAYVGGPAEIAYHAQIKGVFDSFGRDLPVLIPRLSASIRESHILKSMQELPFQFEDYASDFTELKKRFMTLQKDSNVMDDYEEFKQWLSTQFISKIDDYTQMDVTLRASYEKTGAKMADALGYFQQKLNKSLELKHSDQLRKIRIVQEYLFPNGPMERVLTPAYFIMRYGISFWQQLAQELEHIEIDIDGHYVIDV